MADSLGIHGGRNLAAGIHWEFHPELTPALRDYLRSGEWAGRLVPVTSGRPRSVYRLPAAGPDLPGFYVKHDHPHELRRRLRGLFFSKARSEYASACELEAADVPTPRPCAWGRRGVQGFLVTLEIPDTQPFLEAWLARRDDPPARALFLARLGEFLGCLVAAGVVHPDLHVGNVLASGSGDTLRFVLIDPYRAHARQTLGTAEYLALLHWLGRLGPDLRGCEVRNLLAAAGLSRVGASPHELWEAAMRDHERVAEERWPDRRSRLLRNSALCREVRLPEGRWRVALPNDIEILRAAVARHEAAVGEGHLLKDDVKRRLSRVTVGSLALVVKEFRRPGVWRFARDRQCWLNAHRLARFRVRTASALGWLRTRDGRGLIVFADVGPRSLKDEFHIADARARRRLAAAAGRLLGTLHRRGILPGDFKSSNLIPTGGNDADGWPSLALIDVDALRFGRHRISDEQCAAGVTQFFSNLEGVATPRDRLAFLAGHRRTAGRLMRGISRLART